MNTRIMIGTSVEAHDEITTRARLQHTSLLQHASLYFLSPFSGGQNMHFFKDGRFRPAIVIRIREQSTEIVFISAINAVSS